MTFKEYKERLDKFFNDYPELHNNAVYVIDPETILHKVRDNGIISSVFISKSDESVLIPDEDYIEGYLNDQLGESPDLDFETEREWRKERNKLRNSLVEVVVIN